MTVSSTTSRTAATVGNTRWRTKAPDWLVVVVISCVTAARTHGAITAASTGDGFLVLRWTLNRHLRALHPVFLLQRVPSSLVRPQFRPAAGFAVLEGHFRVVLAAGAVRLEVV